MQDYRHTSLEARREGGNDPLNKCRELEDRFEQRLRLDNLRLIQRYVESKLKVLVRFRIGGIGEELVACFQRKANVRDGREESAHDGELFPLERVARGRAAIVSAIILLACAPKSKL
jgi:hypothetical protein